MTPTATDGATAARLLDAAERAFAEKGFDGASMRAITTRARANLAAVHYHFGSKEDLFVAVVARRLEPLNAERLRLLDRAEARAGNAPLEVEEIVEILIGPVLRAGHADGKRGGCALRFFGRMQSESEDLWKRIMLGPLREIRRRMFAALRRALPKLPQDELALRMHFVFGAMKSVASDQHRLRAISDGLCDPGDIESVIAAIVPFLAAGLRAPARRKPSRGTAR